MASCSFLIPPKHTPPIGGAPGVQRHRQAVGQCGGHVQDNGPVRAVGGAAAPAAHLSPRGVDSGRPPPGWRAHRPNSSAGLSGAPSTCTVVRGMTPRCPIPHCRDPGYAAQRRVHGVISRPPHRPEVSRHAARDRLAPDKTYASQSNASYSPIVNPTITRRNRQPAATTVLQHGPRPGPEAPQAGDRP